MRSAFYADVSSTALRALNYAPEVEAFRRMSRKRRCWRLGEIAEHLGGGYRLRLIRQDCDANFGKSLLSQGDIFATQPSGRVIRYDVPFAEAPHRIDRWQLLVAGAGTLGENELFGRTIIADARFNGMLANEDVFSIRFVQPDSLHALYCYAFLCSGAGVRAVRSAAYGTKILKLRRSYMADLPIPLGTDEQIARVAALVRETVAQREAYAEHLREARTLLEKIPGFSEARAMSEHRHARCIRWEGALPTMTAWTFASAGEAIAYLGQRWRGRLGDVVEEQGLYNGPRFARVPCSAPHGVDFVSQRDAFMIRPVPRRIVNPGFADRLLFVRPGTLLVGGHGTLGEGEIFGRVEIASGNLAKMAFTQDILRVLPRAGFEYLAYALLSSIVGFRLLRTTAVGTKILSLRPDLLRALPFPTVEPTLKAQIDQAVSAALTARATADAAESEAVRIIEQEVLPTWLA